MSILADPHLLSRRATARWRQVAPRPRHDRHVPLCLTCRQQVDDEADPKLRRQLQVYIYARSWGCMIVMAAGSFALPLLGHAGQGAGREGGRPAAPGGPHGHNARLSARANQDGTLPEQVIVHVVLAGGSARRQDRSRTCTDAAYVTGVLDPATHEASQLIGGRLNREGAQTPQVWLTLLPDTRRMEVRFGAPDAKPQETHDAPAAPWRMYDFDLAEFALGPRETKDFAFGLAMAWPDGTSPALRILGGSHCKIPL